jgi:hypothetical protein
MRFLTTRQYRGVYNMSSPSLREQFGAADDFQRWFAARPELHPTTWSREGLTDDGADVIVRGTATFEDGHVSPIQVRVALINGRWRVRSFTSRASNRFGGIANIGYGRHHVRTVGFAHGPHYSFGPPLARLEGQIAIGTVVQAFVRLEIQDADIDCCLKPVAHR